MTPQSPTAVATFGGLKILVNDAAFPRFREDWSDVRSPSRAARRRKRGFPQRIKMVPNDNPDRIYQMGDTLVMHSETYRKLREQTGAAS